MSIHDDYMKDLQRTAEKVKHLSLYVRRSQINADKPLTNHEVSMISADLEAARACIEQYLLQGRVDAFLSNRQAEDFMKVIKEGDRVLVFDPSLFKNDVETPPHFTFRLATVMKRY